MKKIIFSFLVTILFITLGISGCISNDTDDGGGNADDSSGGIDLQSLNKKIVGTWREVSESASITNPDDYMNWWYFYSDGTGYRDSWSDSYDRAFEWETAELTDLDWKYDQITKPGLHIVWENSKYYGEAVYFFSFSNNYKTLLLEEQYGGVDRTLYKD